MDNIRLETDPEGIGVACIDMPGKSYNVFSQALMDDFERLIEHAQENLKGLIITSGKQAFVAGADLAMIKEFADMRFSATPADMRKRFSRLGQLFRRLESLRIPVVAAINGLALGGGLELAMACHKRVCINTRSSILGLPEIVLGLLPGAGGTQRLPRYVGVQKGIQMLLGGSPVTPAEALEYGLVDELVSPEELIDRARDLIKNMDPGAPWDFPEFKIPEDDLALISDPGWNQRCLVLGGWLDKPHDLYPAVDAITRCVDGGLPLSMDEGCDIEWDIFVALMQSPVPANMVATCFLNKVEAPKVAKDEVSTFDSEVASYHWAASQPEPKPLSKMLLSASADEAQLVVVDENQVLEENTPGAENSVLLRNVLFDRQQAFEGVELRYTGMLGQSEAIELAGKPHEMAARAVTLVKAMDKVPVWVNGHPSVIKRLLDALSKFIINSPHSSDEIVAAAEAVELLPAIRMVDASLPSLKAVARKEDSRTLGLNMMAAMALESWSCVEESVVDRLESLDVLAVYALQFPKWTGGPIAYLAMLQRNEIDNALLEKPLKERLQSIHQPLKIMAAYNSIGAVVA